MTLPNNPFSDGVREALEVVQASKIMPPEMARNYLEMLGHAATVFMRAKFGSEYTRGWLESAIADLDKPAHDRTEETTMMLPKSVSDAVESINDSETVQATPHPDCNALVKIIDVDDWQTIRAHLLGQESKIEQLRSIANVNGDWSLKYSQMRDRAEIAESHVASADALATEWRDLVLTHNSGCEAMCDPDRCKYRPYLEANGRRCPECPVNDMIEIPDHLQGGEST